MDKIIFILLTIFPFGQLLRFNVFLLIDVLVIIAAIYAVYKKLPRPIVFKYIKPFLLVATFSFFLFWAIFPQENLIRGLMYLVRLYAYSYFLIFVFNLNNLDKYFNYLLSLSLVSGVFGWIQYFLIPDFDAFTVYGWDEHLYRLIGTFFDPAFLGLIIVFGIIIAFYKKNNPALLFLLPTLAFTYSRASYLAILFVFIYFFIKTNQKIKILVMAMLLTATVFILPRPEGESVKLERTASISKRFENYIQTIKLSNKFPLFGIGYNNLCFARQKYIEIESPNSHSCSGSDSSILFILATTGILGLISFIYSVVRISQSLNPKYYILNVSFMALFIHSIFSNSIFYPFVMFYLILLIGITLRREVYS